MRILERISDLIAKITIKLACFFIFGMTLILLIQVVLRYIFNTGIPSADEIAKYSIIWAVCLAGNVLIREDILIKVDFMDHLWPETFLKWRDKVYQVVIILLLVFLAKEGWLQAVEGWHTKLTSLDLPWFYPYLAVPVGALLMLFQSVFVLIKSFRQGENAKMAR